MRQEREPVPLLRSILASTTSSVDMVEMMLEIGTYGLQEDESQQIEMY